MIISHTFAPKGFTVGELREVLAGFNQDAPVMVMTQLATFIEGCVLDAVEFETLDGCVWLHYPGKDGAGVNEFERTDWADKEDLTAGL